MRPGKDLGRRPACHQVRTLGAYLALIPDDASGFILRKTNRPGRVLSESVSPTVLLDSEGSG